MKKGVKPEERAEEQVVVQAPIVVILGGEKYEIKPLVIKDSREWRRKAIKLIAPLPQLMGVTIKNPKEFEKALSEILVVLPDQVIEHFFEYAKDLNRKEIEAKATDAELVKAFEEVVKVAFPLAKAPGNLMARLSQ